MENGEGEEKINSTQTQTKKRRMDKEEKRVSGRRRCEAVCARAVQIH